MADEQIMWIALPAHRNEQGALRLNAYASIRLTPSSEPAALAEFSQGIQAWASTVAATKFTVEFDGVPLQTGITPSSVPDPKVWAAIFPPETPVRTGESNLHEDKPVNTFAVSAVLAALKDVYGDTAAESGTEPPWIDDPQSPLFRLRPLDNIVDIVPTSYLEEQAAGNPPGVVINPEYQDDKHPAKQPLGDVFRFYNRPWFRNGNWPDNPQLELDFHERLALLGDHPELLRRLGIIVTLDLEGDNSAQLSESGEVAVYPDGEKPPVAVNTAYELDASSGFFWVRPHGKDPEWLRKGWLTLGEGLFETYQVDVDGGALKLIEFASHLGHLLLEDLRGPRDPMQAALPSLRSAGWTVAWKGKAQHLFEKFQAAENRHAALKNQIPVTLYAEQLVRGYRIDVFEGDAQRWLSLHQRQVSHTFPLVDLAPTVYADEGFVKGFTATSNPNAEGKETTEPVKPGQDLYVHEALFGWEGWSLAARRPGKHLPQDGTTSAATVAAYDEETHGELGVATTTQAQPKSLPRLRFGREYAFRARAVDLAGVSLPHSDDHAVAQLQSEPTAYLRFEPVEAPVLIRRYKDTEGESLGHLVIRSNGDPDGTGMSAAAYAALLNGEVEQERYRATSDRHVLPPKTTQFMAETHGRFDAIFDGASPHAMYQLASREGNSYGQADDPASPEPLDDYMAPESHLELVYLPDPWASGVRLVAYDTSGSEIAIGDPAALSFDYPGNWPDLKPYRLTLREGPTFGVESSADQRLLYVTLPKAFQIRLTLSSRFPGGVGTLNTFALWHWNPNKGDAMLANEALHGRHWMLTPGRTISLTHAVQQPLAFPNSQALSVHRRVGDTYVTLLGRIENHAQSTGRLDVVATWQEPLDDPDKPEPDEQVYRATACGFEIDAVEDAAQVTMVDPRLAPDDRETTSEWGRCLRCQTLVSPATGREDRCPAAGPSPNEIVAEADSGERHLLVGPERYWLNQKVLEPGEAAWRTCLLCSSLFRSGLNGPCSAGANHVGPPLSNMGFALPTGGSALGQAGWWPCKKCGCLYYTGARPQLCPASGQHEPYGHTEYIVPRLDRVSRHGFGDTKHRTVVYHTVATTRFREFFPSEITNDPRNLQREEPHEGRAAVPLTRVIPSSARPAAPRVEYVVPTFRWEDRSTPTVRAHSRIGRGVRIYLRRPWFSSGDGELLGVLLRQERMIAANETDPLEDKLTPYVTDFGSDPVWESARPPARPLLQHFPLVFANRPDVAFELEELPGTTVFLAPHQVYWDGERKLWYADIDIDIGDAYFPMVRFALARYQPHSLPGCHLSRVVQTDFIQPLPDRHAQVLLTRGGAQISVSGVIGRNRIAVPHDLQHKHAPEMSVELQEHQADLEDLGWHTLNSSRLSERHEGFSGNWQGSIALPPGIVGSGRHRLLIIERELYPRDRMPDEPLPHVPDVSYIDSRIVYTDTFDL